MTYITLEIEYFGLIHSQLSICDHNTKVCEYSNLHPLEQTDQLNRIANNRIK